MSKYIDADLLRKDIDNWKEAMADAVGEYSDGVRFALEHFTFVLDSLQQEQQEVDFEKEYTEFVVSDPVYSKLVNIIVGKLIARHFYELGKNSK